MKTSRSTMSLSSSASDTSKKTTFDSGTLERPKKTKKPGVIAQITRRTKTTQPATNESVIPKDSKKKEHSEPVISKKKDQTPDKRDVSTTKTKMATLPRMFKPKSSRSPVAGKASSTSSQQQEPQGAVSGKNTLPKSSSMAFHDLHPPSPPVKRQAVSKTASLSFNELKKQHQFSMKELEDLRTNMIQMDQRHGAEMGSLRDELSEADKTIETLKGNVQTKEAELAEKDQMILNMEAQCLKLELEKDRLLMVIECAQRDALTGEKIIPDIASWQTMMDEAHSQTEQFLHHMDSMTTALLELEEQSKKQTYEIESGIKTFREENLFIV